MAKFCGNCGARMDDNARVCGYCGTPLAASGAAPGGTPGGMPGGMYGETSGKTVDTAKNNAESMKKVKKIVISIVAALLAIAIVVTGVTVVTSFTGVKGTVRKVMKVYEDYDVDAFAAVCSDVIYEMASQYSYYSDSDPIEDIFEETIGGDLDQIEYDLGYGTYKISYEINKISKVSDRKMNALFENLEESSVNPDIIQDVRLVDITITAKAGRDDTTLDKTLILTKESGKWHLLLVADNYNLSSIFG